MLGLTSHTSDQVDLGPPFIHPENNTLTQQEPVPVGLVSESSCLSPTSTSRDPEPEKMFDERSQINTVSDLRSNGESVSVGKKRKGEEIVGRAPKKSCLKDTENAAMTEGFDENSGVGKEQGEGTSKSPEAKK